MATDLNWVMRVTEKSTGWKQCIRGGQDTKKRRRVQLFMAESVEMLRILFFDFCCACGLMECRREETRQCRWKSREWYVNETVFWKKVAVDRVWCWYVGWLAKNKQQSAKFNDCAENFWLNLIGDGFLTCLTLICFVTGAKNWPLKICEPHGLKTISLKCDVWNFRWRERCYQEYLDKLRNFFNFRLKSLKFLFFKILI